MLNIECILLFKVPVFLTIFNFFANVFCFKFALLIEVTKNKEE